MYKIVDESIFFFSKVFLSKFSQEDLSFSTFHGYKGIYSRYEIECEKSFLSKIGYIGESLRDWDES